MRIAVAGTGYVGLSMATLLAQHNEVIAVDILPEKVEMINRRKSPIQDEYIEKYFAEKNKNIKVGDYVNFGTYEQDNNTSNGKEEVEWLVLEVKDGKALIISKYALDCKPYNTGLTGATWETCTLRKWLNNNFINAVSLKFMNQES